jgi:hypothetical protein
MRPAFLGLLGERMRRWISLMTALLVGGCAATVNPTLASASVADAPPLIAGRLSAAEGDVRIWRTEEDGRGAWDRAELNDVVSGGVGIATDNGRAEVRVGPHALRLGAGSTGGFSQLDFAGKVFNLERGVLNVRLAPAQQGEAVAVVVAGVQIDLAAPGRYRIDAIDGAPLTIAVFEGQSNVRYGTNSVAVGGGQALLMTQSNMSFGSAMTTELDAWAFERDERYRELQSARYVSPYMTGYEELDAHGDWIADGSYGTVWVPRAVPVGWAPYRFGRWRWVAPWGWTWVDAAPWGYAPFHYGRWVMVGGRWGWWPGSFVARPVWAPALVGFVGTGGTSVSIGFGGPVVGWYPLAPWHPYRPHYRTNTTYVTVINQTIIQRPPPGVPRDLTQRPGSTWVPQQRFHEPVAKVRIPAQTEKIADLQPMAPPPRPVRTAPISDDVRAVPPGRVASPQGRGAWGVAQTTPKYSTAPPQPLPGANGTLNQPAPIRGTEPRATPPAPAPQPEVEVPRPKAHVPSEIVPPYQQLQKPFPAEPARVPPAAPPTVRQPPVSGTVSPSRAVAAPASQPSPVAAAAPAARTAPPGHTPRTPPAAAGPLPASAKQDAAAQGDDTPAPRPDVPRPKKNVMEK